MSQIIKCLASSSKGPLEELVLVWRFNHSAKRFETLHQTASSQPSEVLIEQLISTKSMNWVNYVTGRSFRSRRATHTEEEEYVGR
jgi:hypothetical protein